MQISRESTFASDIRRYSDLQRAVSELAAEVAQRLQERDRAGRTITVKLRYSRGFRTVTRSHTLPAATQDPALIGRIAWDLARAAVRHEPGHLRLVGVGVAGLGAQWQLTLPEADRPA